MCLLEKNAFRGEPVEIRIRHVELKGSEIFGQKDPDVGAVYLVVGLVGGTPLVEFQEQRAVLHSVGVDDELFGLEIGSEEMGAVEPGFIHGVPIVPEVEVFYGEIQCQI